LLILCGGEQGNQWLTKPSFTFHNVSASAGFHKEFTTNLNWYSNISLAMKSNPSEFFSDGSFYRDYRVGDLALDKEVAVKLSTTVQQNGVTSR
jgi:iron complex outermembrane receptor protein